MASPNGTDQAPIIDIRQGAEQQPLVDQMWASLSPVDGSQKTLPTMLLYDKTGLQLFEDITYLEEYYLTNAEIAVLTQNASQIVQDIKANSTVVELGSGNLRKVKILLDAFEQAKKPIKYYALDLSEAELQRTLKAIPRMYQYVQCYGLFGSYDDGLVWLQNAEQSQQAKCIVWLGSSIGNFDRKDAIQFIRNVLGVLFNEDTFIIGVDACQDKQRVWPAYNDKKGKTHEFVLNGLVHANKLASQELFHLQDWSVIGEYDMQGGRHQAFVVPNKNLSIGGIKVKAGERIKFEESNKYSAKESAALWEAAGAMELAKYGASPANDHHLHVIAKKAFTFASHPEQYAASPIPSLDEYQQLWTAWDFVTQHMIREEDMLSRPIKLRNPCLFYLGHIPAFLDIHLTRATVGQPTEPAAFHGMFERGIDPDVEDPAQCHAHSKIPDQWPALKEILEYQDRVRNRVRSLYDSINTDNCNRIGRALWLTYEHEAMHLETLLYMLLQSDSTLPPPGKRPSYENWAARADQSAMPNKWFQIPSTDLHVGMDDAENEEGPDRYFGWDIEKPERKIHVQGFEAKGRAITNRDYAHYLEQTRSDDIPESWTDSSEGEDANGHVFSNGQGDQKSEQAAQPTLAFLKAKYVRTLYGKVPLKDALHWPVAASYDEISRCAQYMGGRIPTAEEVRSIWHFAEMAKEKESAGILSRKISAVNGHLSNGGIEISPPLEPAQNGTGGPHEAPLLHQLFADLEGCNIGFKNFHPTPVTHNGTTLSGQGDFGGLWEWTSSVLEKHEGFEPGKLYPAYANDFFDGKHNIILGGSWATVPRIAGRKTFVNWYQRNYRFAWAGARLVRDLR